MSWYEYMYTTNLECLRWLMQKQAFNNTQILLATSFFVCDLFPTYNEYGCVYEN
jgi:hypothetical protein